LIVEQELMVRDREFMAKVFEQGSEEAYDLILRRGYLSVQKAMDLKTLDAANRILNVIAR
jgi:uncharacterized protein YqfA (UPF0365 family)